MSISVNENTGEKVGEGMAFELPFKNCLNVWHCSSQVAQVNRIVLIFWVYQNFLARCRLLLCVESFKSYYVPSSSAFSLLCSWSHFFYHCTYEHVPTHSVTDETVPCGTHFQSKWDQLMFKKGWKGFLHLLFTAIAIYVSKNFVSTSSASQPCGLAYFSCCF